MASRPPKGPDGAAGFHLNELYSPWSSFGEIASDFVEAKRGGRETCRPGSNVARRDVGGGPGRASRLGDPAGPAEPYNVLSVPAGGLFLTVGVDVQNDRLVVVIVAWGRGEESWRVYFGRAVR